MMAGAVDGACADCCDLTTTFCMHGTCFPRDACAGGTAPRCPAGPTRPAVEWATAVRAGPSAATSTAATRERCAKPMAIAIRRTRAGPPQGTRAPCRLLRMRARPAAHATAVRADLEEVAPACGRGIVQ